MDEEDLRFAAQAIREAERVVAMTGAGVSTGSGIPDFRGENGRWKTHDPADFHRSRFEADPEGFWRDRLDIDAARHGDRAPNPAHDALADLESSGNLDALVTQNVDGLHTKAGSRHVIELHGSGERVVCCDCGRRFPAAPVRERVRDGETPPRCGDCGGVLKPDVVLFGEQLPQAALFEAHALAGRAEYDFRADVVDVLPRLAAAVADEAPAGPNRP